MKRGGEMREELKPCPFCGRGAIILEQTFPWQKTKHYFVKCYGGGCAVIPATLGYASKQKAIAVWNRRAR